MQSRNKLCPLDSQLQEFGANSLENADAQSIRKHLDLCNDCRGSVASFEELNSRKSTTIFPQASQETSNIACPSETSSASSSFSQPNSQLPESIAAALNAELGAHITLPLPKIPGFKIISELGSGGMGVVYEAEQLGLNRRVALKMIRPQGLNNPDLVERFRIEAESVARLEHPNIVRIHEVGEVDGSPYFSLEFVAGGSLDKLASSDSISAKDTAELIASIASGLEYAHQHGVVHRDLKPANILLSEKTTPKITDFGLARLTDEDQRQTRTGMVMGTPAYMAPEQAAGNIHDNGQSVDIYSLGVILYELLTGRVPFRGESVAETLKLVEEMSPVPPSKLHPHLHRDLETICLKCLQKDPGNRYETAGALRLDLLRFIADEPIVARPVSVFERAYRWAKRKPLIASLWSAVALLLISIIVIPTIFAFKLHSAKTTANAATATADLEKKEAIKQERIAKEKEAEARRQEALAREAESRAETETRIAKRRHAASVINLAANALEDRKTLRAIRLLETQRPRFDEPDFRSFDWYRIRAQCSNGFQHSFNSGLESVTKLAHCEAFAEFLCIGTANTLRILNSKTGELIQQFDFIEVPACLAISDDGLRAMCGFRSGILVELRRVNERWKQLRSYQIQGDLVWDIEFFPKTHQFVTSHRNAIVVRDCDSGSLIRRFDNHSGSAIAFATSRDGSFASLSNDGSTMFYRKRNDEWESARKIFNQGGHVATGLAFSSDGSQLAIGDEAFIQIVETGTLKQSKQRQNGSGKIQGMAFGNDDNSLFYGGSDGGLQSWNLKTGEELVVANRGAVQDIALIHEDHTVLGGLSNGQIAMWQIGTSEASSASRVLKADKGVKSCRVSHDGKFLAVGQVSGGVDLFDAVTHKHIDKIPVQLGNHHSFDFSQDGSQLAVGSNDGGIKVWDIAKSSFTIENKAYIAPVAQVAFSPDGRNVAFSSRENSTAILSLELNKFKHVIHQARGGVPISFSDDGTWLATSNGQQPLIWNMADSRIEKTLAPSATSRGGSLSSILFSPDSRLLAVGNTSGTISVWDTESWELCTQLEGHIGKIIDLSFDASSSYVLSLADDATLRYWDVEIGQERCSWPVVGQGVAVALAEIAGVQNAVLAHRDGRVHFSPAPRNPELVRPRDELNPMDPLSPVAMNSQGKRELRSGDLQSATANFTNAKSRLQELIVAFPNEMSYRAQLGIALCGLAESSVHKRAENYLSAIEAFRLRLQSAPNDTDSRDALAMSIIGLANHYQLAGHANQARQLLRDSIKSCSLTPTSLAKLTILLATAEGATEEDREFALRHSQTANEQSPGDFTSQLALGIAQYYAGDFAAAMANLHATSYSYTLGQLRWRYLAMVYAQLDDRETAVHWMRRTYLQSDQPQYKDSVGVTDAALARISAEMRSIVDADTNDSDEQAIDPVVEAKWWYEEGMKTFDLNPGLCIDYFQRSSDLNHTSAPNMLAGARAAIAVEDWNTAIVWLNAGTKIAPANKEFLRLRADIYHKLGYFRFSGADYAKLAELESDKIKYWLLSARDNALGYNFDVASDSIERALAIKPDNEEALSLKSKIAREQVADQ